MRAEHPAISGEENLTVLGRHEHLIHLFVRWKAWAELAIGVGMDPSPVNLLSATEEVNAYRAERAYRTLLDPSVDLAGAGSRAELFGVGFAGAGQHLESQVFLHHRGAHTSGQVLYKTALQGESARSVWVGDVLIGPDAVGTDTYEANRNLVLTEGARAESVPNLEIETGDIRGAGHASATGRFDDEQLFYLQSRGIPADEARRLVVLGFLVEVVQKIGVPALESELVTRIRRELDERVGG